MWKFADKTVEKTCWWQEGRSLPVAVVCLPRSSSLVSRWSSFQYKQSCMDSWESQSWCLELAVLQWEGEMRAPCRSRGHQGVSGERYWGTWQEHLIRIQAAPVLLPVELLLALVSLPAAHSTVCSLWTPSNSFASTNIAFLQTEVKIVSWNIGGQILSCLLSSLI